MADPKKLRTRLAGVVFLTVPALLVWLSVAVYDKEFSDDAEVTLHTGAVGNEMHRNADVKLRGVVIGQVREITADPDGNGARLTLALDRDKIGSVPADVTAQMLPTTLFGQRFVALVPPQDGAGTGTLKAGDTISQDRSSNAIELEQVLDNVLPLLTAVKPEKLSATLTAVATALEGRGDKLGTTLVELGDHLEKLNPQLPTLNRDIQQLVKVTKVYGDNSPDILQALTDFTTTSSTLVEEEAGLAEAYGSTTATANEFTTFLRNNKSNIIRLSASSRPTLELLAEYSSSFPCTLRTLAGFVPAMDKALGKGTDEPGLHVNVRSVPSRGKYLPGKDTPAYTASGGPQCYSVPYNGGSAPMAVPAIDKGLGLPNSPQENQLVNELVAPDLKVRPQALPDWSSLLLGPAFRGAEVKLK